MRTFNHGQPDAGDGAADNLSGTDTDGTSDTSDLVGAPVDRPDDSGHRGEGHGNGAAPSVPGQRPTEAIARRRWPYVVTAAGVVGVGAIAAAVVLSGDDEPVDTTAPAELSTVSAAVGDLVQFTDLDGRMVYADTDVITASADGIVTAIVATGDVIGRGSVVAEVNGAPMVAFIGEVPLYRPLVEGMSGDDVLMVERNLAALGYHTELDDDGDPVDDGFVVDGEWDAATTAAVERMQDDLGMQVTGELATTDVAVITGDATVIDRTVAIGDRVATGTPLLELNAATAIETVHADHGGDLDLSVAEGDTIVAGDIVYVVDDLPITAVVAPDGIDRDLRNGVDDGDDVLAVESMLVELGYDASGDLVVDTEFDDATDTAVREWQEDLQNTYEDVRVDGRIGPDDLFVVEEGETVGVVTEHDTAVLASGTELWSTTTATTARQIETEIAVSDQDRLALGTVVDVEFPDGTIVAGTVSDVATTTTVDPTNPDAEATIAVTLDVAEIPASAVDLVEVDVVVKLVDELADDVVIVPVGALVARGDGVFAVEALTTTGTTFITVEPGMFDDGFVEVDGLQAGVQVVVP